MTISVLQLRLTTFPVVVLRPHIREKPLTRHSISHPIHTRPHNQPTWSQSTPPPTNNTTCCCDGSSGAAHRCSSCFMAPIIGSEGSSAFHSSFKTGTHRDFAHSSSDHSRRTRVHSNSGKRCSCDFQSLILRTPERGLLAGEESVPAGHAARHASFSHILQTKSCTFAPPGFPQEPVIPSTFC